jgi:nucleotide-binding universal stress UspA family protein
MLTINTILYPTDFSERSAYALQLATSLARDHGARLIVLNVVPPPAVAYGEVITGLGDAEYKEQMRQNLERLRVPDPAVKVDYRLEEGDPVRTILDVAAETKADLIVMGTHGRTGLGRLLLGSVAEQVLRNARCPVLAVKAPFPESTAGDQQAVPETIRG